MAAAVMLVLGGAGCPSLTGEKKQPVTTGPVGVFVSNDKGETWQSSSLLPQPTGVKSLSDVGVYGFAEDPEDTKALYWPSRGSGLLFSFDNGKEWNLAGAPLNTGFIYSVAVHPKDRCTIVATNGRQLFKSIDCNRNWTSMFQVASTNQLIRTIAFSPTSPHHLYIGLDSGDLLKSEDGGNSWQTAHRFGTQLSRIAFDPQKEGLVYLATRSKGLLRSRDGGATWENLDTKLREFPGALEYRRLYLFPSVPEHVYWISKHGILASRNAGQDWEALNLITPPGSASIYAFAVNPKNEKEIYYTGTINNRSTFYRSVDGGKTWVTRKLPTGQVPTVMRIQPDTGALFLGFTAPVAQ